MDEVNEEEARVGPTPSIQAREEDNCFRILLATDNHIGYNEKDPIRGQDSINTFKEILELAREHQVDFILLAGDLFHENRPSRACIHQVIALLREYTFGDRPVSMELMSEPMIGATPGYTFPPINYEDSNLNVAIPCFSIHGNHDDPQGTGPEGALCALDILSVAGVINYFGKVHLPAEDASTDPSNEGMKLQPVLLRKGTTQLAMYGVGNVKDQRMYNELRAHRVRMFLPEEDEGGDDWFYMMLVHQNRVKHGPQLAIPEGLFDDKVDLVVWGHEHDCRIEPEPVAKKRYYITQPGSSVATSLAHGEAIEKKVAILHIQGKNFQIDPITLKTVRPFKMDELVLAEEAEDPSNDIDLEKRESITAYLQKRVNALIDDAKKEWDEKHSDEPEVPKMMLPLIRIRVETTGVSDPGNAVRFGQAFAGRIANPKDVLQYYRKKISTKKGDRVQADNPTFSDDDDLMEGLSAFNSEKSKLRMNELVNTYLQAQTLEVLAENQLEDAVHRYVDKEDPDAIKDFVAQTLKEYKQHMNKKGKDRQFDDEETLMAELAKEKEKNVIKYAETGPPAPKKGKGKKKDADPLSDESMLDDDEDASMNHDSDRSSVAPAPKKRAPAKKAAPAKGKGKGKSPLFDPDSDEEQDELQSPASSSEEGFAPGVMAAKKKAAPAKKAPVKKAVAKKPAAKKGTGGTQSQLSFGRPAARAASKSIAIDISDDSE